MGHAPAELIRLPDSQRSAVMPVAKNLRGGAAVIGFQIGDATGMNIGTAVELTGASIAP